jgi:hypothetical protein
MIEAIFFVIVFLFVGLLGVFFYTLITAPEGWEDDDGFHYGRKN